MKNFIFRKAVPADCNRLTLLRKNQLIDEGSLTHINDMSSAVLSNFYKKYIANEEFVLWVAEYNGEIIATGGLSFSIKPPYTANPSGKIGIVSNVYTMPQFRRKGIAKHILELIVSEAEAHECGFLQITASEVGVKLYEAFGFEKNPRFLQYKL